MLMTEHGALYVPPQGLILPGGRRLLLVPETEEYLPDGRPLIAGGVFASGLYVTNWIDLLDATQLAVDLSLTTHKWAMYTNTLTPNFSTDVSYSVTNEVSGTGYTARGRTIAAGALPADPLIGAPNCGSDFTSTDGTFTIQWNALGVFTVDLVP